MANCPPNAICDTLVNGAPLTKYTHTYPVPYQHLDPQNAEQVALAAVAAIYDWRIDREDLSGDEAFTRAKPLMTPD